MIRLPTQLDISPALRGWGPWAGVAVVAAGLRLVGLEAMPLDSQEARIALAAWRASLGQDPIGWMPADGRVLLHVMAALFWLFGPSDAAARFGPAVAGAATALLPAALTPILGARACVAAGLALAFAPISVDLSRRADPAAFTALLGLAAGVSAWRFATDRPSWAPAALAISLGLSLAHAPQLIAGLGLGALAALVAASIHGQRLPDLLARAGEGIRASRRAGVLGLAAAGLAATGGLLDLRGVGFVLGDLWGELAPTLAPSERAAWSLVALAAYAAPLGGLAALGGWLAPRRPSTLWLALWGGALLGVAALGGGQGPGLLALGMAPLALLAGQALAHLPLEPRVPRWSGAPWAALALTLVLVLALGLVVSHSLGADRPPSRGAWVMLAALAATAAAAWRRTLPRGEHRPALVALGGALLALWTVSSLAHASFGASPPGAEPLRLDQTDPRFRVAFRELNLAASLNDQLVLTVATDLPATAYWYGRAIPPGERPGAGAIVIREAAVTSERAEGARIPWRVESRVNPADLHPLGLARWALARQGLLVGRPVDVLIHRP